MNFWTNYWFWPHCASYCCSTTSMRCMIPLEIMEIPLQFHFFLFELRRKRLTSRRITSYKKISRATYSGSPCDNSCVRHYQISGHPFFSKVFGVWGLISKRMGNDTYCGKNWIWFYIWLHVVLLDLNLIQSHISTNSWLGHELAKSDLKGCLAKLLFGGLWNLHKSLS